MMPLTCGKAQRRSRDSTMRTSCNGGSMSTQAFRRTLHRWYIADSATGSMIEFALKVLSRAVMVLRPFAAGLASLAGYTSAPAREKISMSAEIMARSVASTVRGSWPSTRRIVGSTRGARGAVGAAVTCGAADADAVPGDGPAEVGALGPGSAPPTALP